MSITRVATRPHLRAGTIVGAEALGLDAQLGSLEVGKLADLVVLGSNPLESVHNTVDIRYVLFNGRLRDGETLDEVLPRQVWVRPHKWVTTN